MRREILSGLMLGVTLGIIGFMRIYVWTLFSNIYGSDWMLVGFSPRKQNLTLYIMHGNDDSQELLAQLGKHKTSGGSMGGCLYINKLSDVDQKVLARLIEKSFHSKRTYSV